MQLKTLVTGANGMLGDALCPLLKKKGYSVYPFDIVSDGIIGIMDIRNSADVMNLMKQVKPDMVFHLAAETDVDKCELNEEHAYATNFKGTQNIAKACKEFDIPMLYVSTAAVFSGNKESGYAEDDIPGNSVNIYGKSKLKGEDAVKSLLSRYYIVRASWMIGGFNKDKKFVWKIAQLLKTKKEIQVVTDTIGSPTFTSDFANGLISIVSRGEYGVYHCVNKGICTRFDIAKKIAEYMGRQDVVLKPVSSDAFPLPAPRPRSEALVNSRLISMGMDNARPWQDALKEYMKDIR